MFFEDGERFVTFGGMLDDGLGVAFGMAAGEVRGLMKGFGGDAFEFGDPFFDVFALGIEAL